MRVGHTTVAWLRRSPLAGGSAAVMAATIVTSLLGFTFWRAVTHHAAPAAVGEASAALAVATTVALLTTQGLQPAIMLRLPKLGAIDRRALVRSTMVVASLVASVVSGAAALLVGRIDSQLTVLGSPMVVFSVGIAGAAQASSGLIDAASVAVRRARGMTARNGGFALAKLLVLVGLFALHLAGGASVVIAIVASWGACGVLSSVLALRWLEGTDRATGPRHGAWRSLRVMELGGFGWHHAAAVSGQLPAAVLPALVAATLGAAQAGYFNVGWMLGGVCFFVSPAIATALLADGGHEPEHLRRRVRIAFLLTLACLAVPEILLLGWCRPVLTLFGRGYAEQDRWLVVSLAVSAVPDAVTNLAVSVYRVEGRLCRAALLNVGLAAGALAVTWTLLRPLGVAAAGLGWLGVQAAGAVFAGFDVFVRPSLRRSPRPPLGISAIARSRT